MNKYLGRQFIKRGFDSMRSPWTWVVWFKGLVMGFLLAWWLV